MFHILECSLLVFPSYEIGPTISLGHLVESPCNMGESKHEPLVEIGETQEALKLIHCG
jgi:hypothetical protein